MRGRIWEIMNDQLRKKTGCYHSTLSNSISILSYFQAEEGCGDRLASVLNALVLDEC